MGAKLRFTRARPCYVCGGFDGAPRGKGQRCYGFASDGWAHCSREEHAGSLIVTASSNTFPHKMTGDCGCGRTHGHAPAVPKRSKPQSFTIRQTYDYLDANGKFRYQVVRCTFDDTGEKTFRQRRMNGSDWIWNLQDTERLPYRLPELLSSSTVEPVFICEGEKDVDRMIPLGLAATCNSEGAGKFLPVLTQWFTDRSCVILPDNDEVGRLHAAQVAMMLSPVAKSVKIVALRPLPPKGDLSDWFDAGHPVGELLQAADSTPVFDPLIVSVLQDLISRVEAMETQFAGLPEEEEYEPPLFDLIDGRNS